MRGSSIALPIRAQLFEGKNSEGRILLRRRHHEYSSLGGATFVSISANSFACSRSSPFPSDLAIGDVEAKGTASRFSVLAGM
jgi:hypothetical protein